MIHTFCHLLRFLFLTACFVSMVFAQPGPQGSVTPGPVEEPATKRGLLLVFISYNNIDSKFMYDQLNKDAGIKKIVANNFALKDYIEGQDPALIGRYQVTKYPTIIAADSDGTEIDRIVGIVRPEQTMAMLSAASKGGSAFTTLTQKVGAPGATIDDRLKFANAAIQRYKRSEALRELQICLDRSIAPAAKEDRRYLKVILNTLVSLGEREPTAVAWLKARRDALEKSLSPHFTEPILVVFAFNDALKDYVRNVDIYTRLPAESPLREKLFPSIFLQLVTLRRYQEAAEGADLESLVNSVYPKKNATATVSTETGEIGKLGAHTVDHRRQRTIELTSAATEALLGVGQLEKSKRIAGRALESFDDKSLETRLQQAAQRADSPAAKDFLTWLAASTPHQLREF